MLTFILFIFLSIGVSIINGSTCACCFSWQTDECQIPAIYISCEDCTSFFCANHVKGCQGTPPCRAECRLDSSSTSTAKMNSTSSADTTTTTISSTSSAETTTTTMSSTSSVETTTTEIASDGYFIRVELFVIFVSLILFTLCQSNL